MKKHKNTYKYAYFLFRIFAVLLFTGGFLYQTTQFLFLYWTYPTVVDIQQVSPAYLEVPAFTICSRSGYIYENFCTEFDFKPCSSKLSIVYQTIIPHVCKAYPSLCINDTKGGLTFPEGFKVIMWPKFMEKQMITTEDFRKIYVPLEDYLNCSITFAGKIQPCNMEYVLGSFYTEEVLPHFCFTIYSKWGNPNKKREMIAKGATMKFHFFLNISRQPLDAPHKSLYESGFPGPLTNPPNDASVQIAVHSPYFLPSPYLEGSSFLSGRNYELRITLSERHLLPLPYQTNCTDYMTTWQQRGGKAPINQLGVIQECRINETYKAIGCIPVFLDYPHNYNICRSCPNFSSEPCPYEEPPNNCPMLADDYNQPCDSLIYHVEKERKTITYFKKVNSLWAEKNDGLRVTLPEHDCEGTNAWKPECSTIEIDIPFDRFEITNMTYNAKFESLELFSVIGGYLGMWLGISLLTVVDVFRNVFKILYNYLASRKRTRIREFNINQKHRHHRKDYNNKSQLLMNSYDYGVF